MPVIGGAAPPPAYPGLRPRMSRHSDGGSYVPAPSRLPPHGGEPGRAMPTTAPLSRRDDAASEGRQAPAVDAWQDLATHHAGGTGRTSRKARRACRRPAWGDGVRRIRWRRPRVGVGMGKVNPRGGVQDAAAPLARCRRFTGHARADGARAARRAKCPLTTRPRLRLIRGTPSDVGRADVGRGWLRRRPTRAGQNVTVVRRPRTAASPNRLAGCCGLGTPPLGSNTYCAVGCTCHHGATCAW